MHDRNARGSDQYILKDFKLVTNAYSARLGATCNIVIGKVCTCDYPNFIKYHMHCDYANNTLLNLGLSCDPLLNSSENKFVKEELGRDILKCTQFKSKRRRVKIESEDNTTEVKDNDEEIIDYKATDNEKDDESVKSTNLLEGLQRKNKKSGSA